MGIDLTDGGWAARVFQFGVVPQLQEQLKRAGTGTPYLRNGQEVFSNAKSRRVSVDAVTDNGRIDLGSVGIRASGSVAPTITEYGFSVVPEANAATIYWDGTNTSQLATVRRTDKTRDKVPAGNMRITALAPSTDYWMYAFWSPNNKCSAGFVVGTVGSPQFCFTAPQVEAQLKQNAIYREELGVIQFKTTAGGTGTPTGTGGRCVMVNTDIETLGDSAYVSELHPESQWIHMAIEGRELNCTRNHPLYSADDGKQDASKFKVGDWIITKSGERRLLEVKPFLRVCTKVHVRMEHGHLFWANDFLSHNNKMAIE